MPADLTAPFSLRRDNCAAKSYTLDEAWALAEKHGMVSLRTESFGKRYHASIMVRTFGGSLLFAKGESDSMIAALLAAIEEAKRHG